MGRFLWRQITSVVVSMEMDAPEPGWTEEEFTAIWRAEEARKEHRREQIRQAVASADAPLPAALVNSLLPLHDGYVREIMQGHAGFELSEKRDSYRASVAIMEQSLSDLLAAIDDFSAQALANSTDLFNRIQEGVLQTIENRIQKELFATTNAAHSLRDHSRRLQKELNIPQHSAALRRYFGEDGLNEFVIALRVLLHHLHIVHAGWHLQRSATAESATFALSKPTLLRVIQRRKDGLSSSGLVLQYVSAQGDSIDLKKLFEEYACRMKAFHAWFSEALKSDSLVALHDYDCIRREKINYDQRLSWKAMLGNWLRNWPAAPNPHNHLHKFLTSEQLRAVYALPLNSREQVDLIIGLVDEGNAIDDELRTLAYELFGRPTSTMPGETLSEDGTDSGI